LTFPLRDKQDVGFPLTAAQKLILRKAKRRLER
jgi:hypothetical protein